MICLKKNTKIFFKSVIISFACCGLFVVVGYFYLQNNFKQTEIKSESVPYSQELDQNVGILCRIDEEPTFFYLDFERELVVVSLTPDLSNEKEIFGYPVDYKIESSLNLAREVVDYLGGLELELGGEELRYTGFQIIDILSTENNSDLKRQVVCEVLSKISQNGVGTDFFVSVIENSKTNLSVSDCFNWKNSIKKLCLRPQLID